MMLAYNLFCCSNWILQRERNIGRDHLCLRHWRTQDIQYEMGQKKRGKMEEIMLILSEFYHNHHHTGVKILAEFI